MRRTLGVLLSIVGGLFLVAAFSSPISARQTTDVSTAPSDDITISVGTVYLTAEPGSQIVLGSTQVDSDVAGANCSWSVSATGTNQHSVHPGNDIVVTSGGTSVTLSGVEDVAGGQTTAATTGPVGSEVTATLVMGPDGIFSGGVTVRLTASECVTTTTAAPTTTEPTTTEPPTTAPTTDVSVEPSTPDTEPTTEPTAAPTTEGTETTETTDTDVTVEPAGPTTEPPTSTTAPTTTAPSTDTTEPMTELPVTGSGTTAALAAAGLAMIVAGMALVRSAERAIA